MNVGDTRVDQVLQAALTGLATRQRVVADNVANVDTPGFKASRVEFEHLLRDALGRPGAFRLLSVPNAVAAAPARPRDITPRIVQSTDTTRRMDGNNVDIDQQMVELAETNLTYNALLQIASSRLQLLRSVISEGRR